MPGPDPETRVLFHRVVNQAHGAPPAGALRELVTRASRPSGAAAFTECFEQAVALPNTTVALKLLCATHNVLSAYDPPQAETARIVCGLESARRTWTARDDRKGSALLVADYAAYLVLRIRAVETRHFAPNLRPTREAGEAPALATVTLRLCELADAAVRAVHDVRLSTDALKLACAVPLAADVVRAVRVLLVLWSRISASCKERSLVWLLQARIKWLYAAVEALCGPFASMPLFAGRLEALPAFPFDRPPAARLSIELPGAAALRDALDAWDHSHDPVADSDIGRSALVRPTQTLRDTERELFGPCRRHVRTSAADMTAVAVDAPAPPMPAAPVLPAGDRARTAHAVVLLLERFLRLVHAAGARRRGLAAVEEKVQRDAAHLEQLAGEGTERWAETAVAAKEVNAGVAQLLAAARATPGGDGEAVRGLQALADEILAATKGLSVETLSGFPAEPSDSKDRKEAREDVAARREFFEKRVKVERLERELREAHQSVRDARREEYARHQ